MITERLSFRAKYGQGDTLVELFKENFQRMSAMGMSPEPTGVRIYTDATGPMFSCVVEFDFPDWQTYAAFQADTRMFGEPEFQNWFARMVEVTEAGDRQLLNMQTLR